MRTRLGAGMLAFSLLVFDKTVAASPRNTVTTPPTFVPSPRTNEGRALGRAGVGGIVLFSVAYGLALSLPLQRSFSGDSGLLAIPIAGPALALGCRLDGVNYWGLIFDQVGQLGGLALVAADFFSTQEAWPPTSARMGTPSIRHGSIGAPVFGYSTLF
jgi:hypothetical protein